MFEAGALSKSLTRSRVAPLLIDLNETELLQPLSQFQARKLVEEDVRRLVHDINSMRETDAIAEQPLSRAFNAFWGELKANTDQCIARSEAERGNVEARPSRPVNEVLGDVLAEIRTVARDSQDSFRLMNAVFTILATINPTVSLRALLDPSGQSDVPPPPAIFGQAAPGTGLLGTGIIAAAAAAARAASHHGVQQRNVGGAAGAAQPIGHPRPGAARAIHEDPPVEK
jgi:hypothetical protein